jgi:hypothetical protein
MNKGMCHVYCAANLGVARLSCKSALLRVRVSKVLW